MSRWEGMPMALLEALSLGRPAVVSPRRRTADRRRRGRRRLGCREENLGSVLRHLQGEGRDDLARRGRAALLFRGGTTGTSVARRYEAAYERARGRRHPGDSVSGRVLDETADTVDGSSQPAQKASWHLPSPRWLSWSLLAVAGLVFVAWLFLAAVHVDDRYRLDHVSGVRMALAQYFDRGTLYPPLYDGQFYGGTRFMPIPIVLHGSLAKLTGEYLISGKLLGYAVMLALLATWSCS